ncbi:choline dehydrogenase [Geminicoccaceae bacterium 1502E]|nr:choline dehydrogenase [Geminicoccaceae bacterium 1502E]
MASAESWDYVVVGAGSAGCAVASRLSEDPSCRVLLLEAGPVDRNPWIHVPVGYYRTMFDPKTSWVFATEPDPGIAGRSINWPRGKVLGGSSSINGLVYCRGQAQDYDHWRQLGNPGWSFDDVLPYFRKTERWEGGASALRGGDGPLSVSGPTYRSALMDAFIEAAKEAGIPENPDYNGESQEGVGYFQLTIRNGLRCSAAKAYLKPAMKRPNLRVVTEALTTRLLLDGHKVTGVEYRRGGVLHEARVTGEVILSAGAIGSPHIMMLSGIGDPVELAAKGVTPVHEVKGVGRNLQDHYQARTVWRSPLPVTINDAVATWWKRGFAGMRFALSRQGPLSIAAGVVALFGRTREELETPDVQFHVIPFSAEKPGEFLHPFSGYTVSVCQLRPESRGWLALKDTDPATPPAIHPNYLATETDRQTMVDGMKLIRRVMGQKAIAPFVAEEVHPGPAVEDDEALLAYVREKGTTIFHPSCTCMMGPADNPMAVVDARLKVHGLAGLRVADCSIMPAVVSGNTNAPAIMIGEKLADMIREERRGAVRAA